MLNKILILIATTITMAGCSFGPAVRPAGTFTSLTVPVNSDIWADGNVQLATKDKRGCGELSKNMITGLVDKDLDIDIEGNRDIFFHLSRADAQVECNKFGIFYATKGNQYTLNLETKNKQCEISMIEKTPSGKQSKINTYQAFVSIEDSAKVCTDKRKLY